MYRYKKARRNVKTSNLPDMRETVCIWMVDHINESFVADSMVSMLFGDETIPGQWS